MRLPPDLRGSAGDPEDYADTRPDEESELDWPDPFAAEGPVPPPTEEDAERMAWLNDQVKRQQGGR
jgi:hypothetical protein